MVVLLTFDAELVPLSFLGKVLVGLLKLLNRLCIGMSLAPLCVENVLELLEPVLLKGDLRVQISVIALRFLDSLLERDLFVLEARDFPLQLSLVSFLVVGDALESGKLFQDLLAL